MSHALRLERRALAIREVIRPTAPRTTHSQITVADLCQAIASGLIPADIDEDNCYRIQKKAIKEYFGRARSARLALAPVLRRS